MAIDHYPPSWHRFSQSWRQSLSLGLAAVCLSLSSCALGQQAGSGPDRAARADEIVAIDATTAEAGTLAGEPTYTGTTEPVQQVALRSRVDGQVTALTVDIGDGVATGDIVARLDADLLTVEVNQAQAELRARESEVAQAQAAVSDAETALESARVQLQQAQTDADRLSRLAAEGAVSAQTAEQAQLTVQTGQQVLQSAAEQIRTRQAAVSAAQGRVEAQQAVVAQTQERLSFAILRSPLSGVVMERLVDPGDYAESGDELMQIGDLSRLKVTINVSDLDLAQVTVGQPVTVRLDAFPTDALAGRITRIAPAADATSRLVPVEITVDNANERVGSGLLARVTLTATEGDRVTIPQAALELADSATPPTVFVVETTDGETGTVQARPVELGQTTDDRVEVLSGLQPGETYVVRSGGELSDGQAVRLSILSETDVETN
ncbi:MAG: efflux RND transporter periplasmic adaptor subunit [Leptolyngbyaceae cyanobacterium]